MLSGPFCRVWGADFLGGERTVDQHITQLRSHLHDDPAQPGFLETVRGKGYRMRPWQESAVQVAQGSAG